MTSMTDNGNATSRLASFPKKGVNKTNKKSI